jgi:transposase InsO family protein
MPALSAHPAVYAVDQLAAYLWHFEEAQFYLEAFIEEVYNAKRLHSSLVHLPPTEFEVASSPSGKTSL